MRAAVSLDLSGDHHAANARDREFSRGIAPREAFFTGTGCPVNVDVRLKGTISVTKGGAQFCRELASRAPQSRKTNVPPAAVPLSPWHRHRDGGTHTGRVRAAVQENMHATIAVRALEVHWCQRSGGKATLLMWPVWVISYEKSLLVSAAMCSVLS